ncbi:MAG: sulfocyanin-like copper-binding protein [Candidatus Bathyarchaeia archaeon]
MVSSFRSTAIGCSFLLATLVGILMLTYDDLLRITPNYHWVVVVAFCVVDAILGMQVLLTAALGEWEKFVIRAAAIWSLMVVIAVLGDVLLKLQLPPDYPTITMWQSFQYLFLGVNGNPIPLAVPALFTIHATAALLGLLPSKSGSFHLDWWPTRRTIVAIALIAIVVMGMGPAYTFLNSRELLPTSLPASNATEIVPPPLKEAPLPYDLANKTVFVTLVAVVDPMLPYNFNDTRFGHLVIYVPANWTIHLVFINREGFPHSAVLMQANAPSPTMIEPSTSVIAQIPTDAISGGFLLNGESGSVVVSGLASGKYWVACAFNYPVPHVEEGMWVVVEVSSQVNSPYFVILP